MYTKEDVIELDRQIASIQRSTRTLFPTFLSLHNNLRMKYRWYYNWHLFNYANAIHTVFLILFTLFTVALSTNVVLNNPKTLKAAGLSCVSQVDGDWSNIATWTSCGGGIPGEGDDATVSHSVIGNVSTDLGTGSMIIDSGGNLTINNGLIISVTNFTNSGNLGNDGTINIAGNFENTGQISYLGEASSSIAFVANDSGHTISSSSLVDNNIEFTGSGEWTLLSNLSTSLDITVSGGNFKTSTYNIEFSNILIVNGGQFTGGSGALKTDDLQILGGTFIAPKVVINPTGEGGIKNYTHTAGTTDWLTNSSSLALQASGDFEIPADEYYTVGLNGNNTTYSLADDIVVENFSTDNNYGLVVLDIADKTLQINGDFMNPVHNTVRMTTGTLKVGGNLMLPEFISGTGTVQLIGINNAIFGLNYGDTSFNNLTIDTSSEPAGKTVAFFDGYTQTINGTLTLNGASGKELTLQSANPGTPWNIAVNGDIVVGDYLNVTDSHVTGGTITTCNNSIDGGGNTGWIFGGCATPTPEPEPTPTPSSATPTPTPSSSSAPSSTSSSTPTPIPSISTTIPVISLLDSSNNSIHYLSNDTKPTIYSQRPTFSGTTYPNSTVEITIDSNPITVTTTSDNKGYWSYTLDQDLTVGDHTIKITVTTPQGKTYFSPIQSFTIASAKETPLPPPNPPSEDTTASTTKPENNNLVYIISFILFIILLGLIYYLATKKKKKISK